MDGFILVSYVQRFLHIRSHEIEWALKRNFIFQLLIVQLLFNMDKAMTDKLITFPMMIKNYLFCKLKLGVETFSYFIFGDLLTKLKPFIDGFAHNFVGLLLLQLIMDVLCLGRY